MVYSPPMALSELGPIQPSPHTRSAPAGARPAGNSLSHDGCGAAVEPPPVDMRKASAALFREVESPNVAWRYESSEDSCSEPSLSPDGGIVVGDGKRLMKLRADGSLEWDVCAPKWTPFRPGARPDGGAVWAPEGSWLRSYDANGQVAWTFGQGMEMQSIQPAVDRDGSVFVCARDGGTPYMIKLGGDGSETWRAPLPMHASSPALLDGRGGCYVRCDDDRLIALDQDGGERWKLPLPGGVAQVGWPADQFNGRPALAPDGSIWLGNDRGRLFRVSPEGEAHELFKARSQLRGAPAFDGDRAYVTSMDRNVYALDLEGHEIWRHDLGDMMEDGAVVLPSAGEPHGDILIAGVSGTVRAITPDGRERWSEQVPRGGSAMVIDPRGTALIGAGKHVVAFRPGAALENLDRHVGELDAPGITEHDGWIVVGTVRVPKRRP